MFNSIRNRSFSFSHLSRNPEEHKIDEAEQLPLFPHGRTPSPDPCNPSQSPSRDFTKPKRLKVELFRKEAEQLPLLGHRRAASGPFGSESPFQTVKKRTELESKHFKFESYRKGAEEGDFTAMYKLSVCYREGSGIAKNDSLAFTWCKLAAMGGNLDAMNSLGDCYKLGIGTVKDKELAFECYKEAADRGNFVAMNNLGDCYKLGIGTVKDKRLAFDCYQKAVDGCDFNAMANLARCYEFGVVKFSVGGKFNRRMVSIEAAE